MSLSVAGLTGAIRHLNPAFGNRSRRFSVPRAFEFRILVCALVSTPLLDQSPIYKLSTLLIASYQLIATATNGRSARLRVFGSKKSGNPG